MNKLFRGKLGFLRLAHWYLKKGFPLRLLLTSDIDIDVLRTMSPTTIIGHPYGITIGKGCRIGANCIINSNVTIGNKYPRREAPMPWIGDGVLIGANSVILGDVHVQDHVVIGAGSIILKDVPAWTTVTGVWK